MQLWQALLLGVVEGLTEFLPVSSTGHLTIVEKLLGLRVDDPGVTAFTAVVQMGAILAVVLYFARDLLRLVSAWGRGVLHPDDRRGPDWRLAWFVILGTVPIGVVGLLARHLITGALRSLWVIVAALVVWSVVMLLAERVGAKNRGEQAMRLPDALVIGAVQCIALIPGVSRSGATISAGLFVGLDRVAATRFAFFLSIPALLAAGGFEAATSAGAIAATVGWIPTLVATAVSFVVGYAAIAWLLRLVARRSIGVFVGYRLVLAGVTSALLLGNVIAAT